MQELKIGQLLQDKYEIKEIFTEKLAIVYKVFDIEYNRLYAMKIYKEEYLEKENIPKLSEVIEKWVNLEKHTNILFANFSQEIEGRQCVFLEYIENQLTLKKALSETTLKIDETLDLAIQFCTAMEFANSRKVIHGDIKTENLILKSDERFPCGFAVKITDFGIANALNIATIKFSPPEKFSEDIQRTFGNYYKEDFYSDIYSFGLMLYVMITKKYPFKFRNQEELIMKIFTEKPPLPFIHKKLQNLLLKCMEKSPQDRYKNWSEIKRELIEIYEEVMKKKYIVIGKEEELNSEEYNNKGIAFFKMQKYEQSLRCYTRALEINSRDEKIWNNKGYLLLSIGREEDAINCFDNSLNLNNKNAKVWFTKGNALVNIKRYKDAINCYDRALEINSRDEKVWYNKGNAYSALGKYEDAINCYDRALEINSKYDKAWYTKGNVLVNLKNYVDALYCYNKALEINSRDEKVWHNKGTILFGLGKIDEAINCYDRVLEINSRDGDAWHNKGMALYKIGNKRGAFECYEKAKKIDGRYIWYGKDINKEEKRKKVFNALQKIEMNDENIGFDIIDVLLSYERSFQTDIFQKIPSETKIMLLKLILTKIKSSSMFCINSFLIGEKYLKMEEVLQIKENMQSLEISEKYDNCYFINSLKSEEDDWIEQYKKMKNELEKLNEQIPKNFLTRTFIFSFNLDVDNVKNFLKEYQIAFNCYLKCGIIHDNIVIAYRKLDNRISEFILILLKERSIEEIIKELSLLSIYHGKIIKAQKNYEEFYLLMKKIEEKVKNLNERVNKEIESGTIKILPELVEEEVHLSDFKNSIKEELISIKTNVSNSEQIFEKLNEEKIEGYETFNTEFKEDGRNTEEYYKNLLERIGNFKDALSEKIDIAKNKVGIREKECLIDEVFLTSVDGRMISHQTRRLMPDEDDIVIAEGMLTAIRDFVRDNKGLELRSFEYGNFKVVIEKGEDIYLSVILKGDVPESLRENMINTIKEIEMNFPKIKTWEGDKEELPKIDNFLNEFIKKFYK